MCVPGSAISRYIDFYTDFAFKKIFGTEANKDLLISFLNCLLERGGGDEIVDLTYLNTEKIGVSNFDRRAIYDVYCVTQSGERFIVEMQKSRQDNFENRTLYYSTFAIQEQAKKGSKTESWNYSLSPVYVVGIINFRMGGMSDYPDKVITKVRLVDDNNRVFNKNLNFIFLEMPKFGKSEDELETFMDKWLFVLKNLCRLQDKPAALTEGIFKKLFEVAEIAAYSKNERYDYEENLKNSLDMNNTLSTARREGVEEGLEKGRAEGLVEGRAEGLVEGRAEGLVEGREEGRAEGRAEGELAILRKLVLAKREKGKTPSEIAEMLEIDIEVVDGILKGQE